MRAVKSLFRSAGNFVLRPGVWLPTLALATVVSVSLAIGQMVVAPAILASDRYTTAPVPSSALPAARRAEKPTGQSAKRLVVEPPIMISIAPERKTHRKRKRARRSAPDVVYRAPSNVPSFAGAGRPPAPPDEPEEIDPETPDDFDPDDD